MQIVPYSELSSGVNFLCSKGSEFERISGMYMWHSKLAGYFSKSGENRPRQVREDGSFCWSLRNVTPKDPPNSLCAVR